MRFKVSKVPLGGIYSVNTNSVDYYDDPYILVRAFNVKDFEDFDRNEEIGQLLLVKTRYGFYETHADTARSSCGIGIKMYIRAFAEAEKLGIQVRSSVIHMQSPDAKRLWLSKTLRKKYRIVKVGRRYIVEKKS